ncbi:MAG: T9SS type A sorting domain-containing protein [Crocinitomicaceae bacterium]|nr:T9SS type A sorting domain-containing protein [Crocinitomicaceae bacterium]
MKALGAIIVCLLSFTSFAATIFVTNTNDSGPGSLRDAVMNAVDYDTIRFDNALIGSGTDTIELSSEIAFSKQLVFKGLYNATDTLYVSGQNTCRVFHITNTNIATIDSMAFINGYTTGDGGALRIYSSDSLFIYNSVFLNNISEGNGGAIFNSFVAWIENTTFRNNSSVSGDGGAYCHLHPSTSSSFVNKFFHLDFINNTAQDGDGGAIFSRYKIEMENSVITDNSAPLGYGGGIMVEQSLSLDSCIVTYNSCGARGGAFYNDNYALMTFFNLKNSTVSYNTAGSNGGAIRGNWANYYLKNSVLTYNQSGDRGGALNCHYDFSGTLAVVIDSCDISHNTASYDGGAIYAPMYGTMYVDRSTFSHNTSGSSGGAIHFFPPATTTVTCWMKLNNSTFYNNTSYSKGGAVYHTYTYANSESIIYNCTFTNNVSLVAEAGGVWAHLPNSTMTVQNTTFKDNVSTIGPTNFYSSGNLTKVHSNIFSTQNTSLSNLYIPNISSLGYNIFTDQSITGSISTDQLGISEQDLNLGSLDNNGGNTLTMMPLYPSAAINKGNPFSTLEAQNLPINGIRDAGSTENFWGVDSQEVCFEYTWINGITYNQSVAGILDTIPGTQGGDSIVVLDLIVNTIDTTLNLSGSTITSNQNGGTYQWLDCNQNYAAIQFATDQFYNPTQPGNYAVAIEVNGCTDTSECKTIDNIGLDENQPYYLKIYPNPGVDYIFISVPNSESGIIRIYDRNGELMYTDSFLDQDKLLIPITNWASGIYILEFTSEFNVEKRRFVKLAH